MRTRNSKAKSGKNFWEADYFRLVVENSNDLIAATDTTGNFLYLSPSHYKILGYKSEELVGKNSFTIIHPDDRMAAMGRFKNALQGDPRPASSFEFRALHKNGTVIPLEATMSSFIRDIEGPPLFVVIIRDISARKELEHNKAEFINIASHELKSPLTSIKAMAQLLQRSNGAKKQDSKKYVDPLVTHIAKMDELVQKLVLFSELQMGTVTLKKKPYSLKKLLNATADLFPNKQIRVNNTLLVSIFIDEKRTLTALYYILQNFLQLTKNNPIIINTDKEENAVTITIEVLGAEISRSEQRKIFRKFYSTHMISDDQDPGFGIDFYIAREVVKLHNGTLDIFHEPKRSCFINLFLPDSIVTPNKLE